MRYQYDAADRLTHAVTPFGSKYYAYDANGNRTSSLAHQDGERHYSYHQTSNQLTSLGQLNDRGSSLCELPF